MNKVMCIFNSNKEELRQVNQKFRASLDYMVKPYLKQAIKQKAPNGYYSNMVF